MSVGKDWIDELPSPDSSTLHDCSATDRFANTVALIAEVLAGEGDFEAAIRFCQAELR